MNAVFAILASLLIWSLAGCQGGGFESADFADKNADPAKEQEQPASPSEGSDPQRPHQAGDTNSTPHNQNPSPGTQDNSPESPTKPPVSEADKGRLSRSKILRIMTYNVQAIPCLKEGGLTGVLSWATGDCPIVDNELTQDNHRRMQTIKNRLERKITNNSAPDLVLFQGVFRAGPKAFDDSSIKVLSEIEGYPYVAWGAPPLAGNSVGNYFDLLGSEQETPGLLGSGLLIISRHPIRVSRSYEFKDCAGSDCVYNKGALYAQIEIKGLPHPIDIYNTDFQSGTEHEEIRYQQNIGLKGFIQQTSMSPFLFVGGHFAFANSQETPSFDDFLARLQLKNTTLTCLDRKSLDSSCRFTEFTKPPYQLGNTLEHQFFDTKSSSVRTQPIYVAIHGWQYTADQKPLSDHLVTHFAYRLEWQPKASSEKQ